MGIEDIAKFRYDPRMQDEMAALFGLMKDREDPRLGYMKNIIGLSLENSKKYGLTVQEGNENTFRELYSYLEGKEQRDLWGIIQNYKSKELLRNSLDAYYKRYPKKMPRNAQRDVKMEEGISPADMARLVIGDLIDEGDMDHYAELATIADQYPDEKEATRAIWNYCEDCNRELYVRMLSGKRTPNKMKGDSD